MTQTRIGLQDTRFLFPTPCVTSLQTPASLKIGKCGGCLLEKSLFFRDAFYLLYKRFQSSSSI